MAPNNREDARTPVADGARLQALLDNFPDLVVRFDTDGRVVYANPAAMRIAALTSQELAGGAPLELGNQANRESNERLLAQVRETIATRSTTQGELVLDLPGGARTYHVRQVPELDAGGRVTSVISIAQEVTERLVAERALKESQEFMASLMQSIDGVVWEADAATFAFSFVSPRAERLLGYPTSRWTTEPTFWTDHLHPDDRDRAVAYCVECTKAARDHEFEYRIRRANGTYVWLRDIVTVVSEAGRPTKLRGIMVDITDQRAAETQLAEREQQYRTLAENTPDLIVRWDRDLRSIYVNDAFARSVGGAPADLIGRSLGSGYAPGLMQPVEAVKGLTRAALSTGTAQEAELDAQTPQGHRTLLFRVVPERDAQGNVTTLLGLGRDITALKEKEAQLLALTEHSPDIITRLDRDVRYLYTNATLERMTGIPAADRLGCLLGEHRGIDPTTVPQEVVELRQKIAAVFETGEALETKARARVRDSARIFDLRVVPEHDDSGVVRTVLFIARDVTEREREAAARRDLEEQLRQSQKMEAVGQLAGGIAHDFNNLLAVIQLRAGMLTGAGVDPREVQEGLADILAAAERASTLTRQLLTFSRRHTPALANIDIGETVSDMIRLLKRPLGEDITLEAHVAPLLPPIRADRGMMEQVLMNLALNARDAMPSGGRLRVAVDAEDVDEERAARHHRRGGRYACISLTDDGTGISEADLPRIFEPFFTTKEVGRGTGLGLATVFGIVELHGGWIEVTSQLGKGTTFRVYLPALASHDAPSAAVREAPARRGSETILLVEDDAAVRKITRSALERYGYRVIEADCAKAALAAWERDGATIDLLFTDLVMPGGMSGRQLADELAKRAPRMKIIYTSGFSPDIVERRLELEPGRVLLQKPYSAADLTANIRACLDGKHR